MSSSVHRRVGRKLLSFFIGSRWQTFIGEPQSALCERSRVLLDDCGWEYHVNDKPVTKGEAVMFGSDDATEFYVSSPAFTVRYVPVTYDPIQRFVVGIALSSDTIDEYKNTASLIQVSPITAETKPAVATFLQELAAEMDSDPWDIDHPRFHRSPFLRYKIRKLWKYWLTADTLRERSNLESEKDGFTEGQPDRETR